MQASDARDAISRRLKQADFTITSTALSDAEALVARRSLSWSTARMHLFFVVFTVDRLSGEEAERLATAAQDYAIKHEGGLPRGMQTGTATIVVFLGENPQDDAVEWIDRSPIHRFAALRFPVLVDVANQEVVYWDGRWLRGWVFRDRILDLVRTEFISRGPPARTRPPLPPTSSATYDEADHEGRDEAGDDSFCERSSKMVGAAATRAARETRDEVQQDRGRCDVHDRAELPSGDVPPPWVLLAVALHPASVAVPA